MKTNIKLSVMMFLQYMMLPVWFVPMFPYVQAMPGRADWAHAYLVALLAALAAAVALKRMENKS